MLKLILVSTLLVLIGCAKKDANPCWQHSSNVDKVFVSSDEQSILFLSNGELFIADFSEALISNQRQLPFTQVVDLLPVSDSCFVASFLTGELKLLELKSGVIQKLHDKNTAIEMPNLEEIKKNEFAAIGAEETQIFKVENQKLRLHKSVKRGFKNGILFLDGTAGITSGGECLEFRSQGNAKKKQVILENGHFTAACKLKNTLCAGITDGRLCEYDKNLKKIRILANINDDHFLVCDSVPQMTRLFRYSSRISRNCQHQEWGIENKAFFLRSN